MENPSYLCIRNKTSKGIMKQVELYNGVKMPQLGYGVYQVAPEEAERCVADALSVGYRMIDTAQAYANEEGVGNAIKKSGISRDEVFVVSKVWLSNYGYERAKASIDESLRKLQTAYIDLMLLHQPFCDYYGAYRALEEAYRAGKLRAIGVSNFQPNHFIDIAENVEIKPMVNQVETHVFCQQRKANEYMKEFGCQIMSWGPLAEGRNGLFSNPVLMEIGKAHGVSAAAVALRYLTQRDVIIIPKSTHKERMEENFSIYGFTLSDAEMEQILALDLGHSQFFDHNDPEVTKMFMGWRGLV